MTPPTQYYSYSYALIYFLCAILLFFPACMEENDETGLHYQETLQALQKEQQILKDGYKQVTSETGKRLFTTLARAHLLHIIPTELCPPWYGTKWDMNGTSQTPKKGTIACGYFVSTVLRDAGFRVNRRKLAQQASEKIVKTVALPQHTKRFAKTPIKKFLNTVRKMGEGLYVVGLDTHVGFLEVRKNEMYFIHSARSTGNKVVKEKAIKSKVLRRSKYRIIGNILANDQLLEKWLKGEKIKTHL